jgi:hypothetical protein
MIVTVIRVEDKNDGFVYVYTDDGTDEPGMYEWDEFVTLYGY